MTLRLNRAVLLAAASLTIATGVSGAAMAAAPAPVPTPADWAALARLPDWTVGVWQIDWSSLFGKGSLGRPDPPALTPEYAAKLDAFKAGQKQGENVQNANANCLPPGMPQIMSMPYPLEFIYSPGRVTIAIETDSQVRRIYTDGRPHPDDPDDAFNGDSIGHWDGNDLVVDTIALDPAVDIAPGVNHSDKVHLVERFHQTGPDTMTIATTIDDPKVLTKPWTVTRPYLRHRDWTIQEYVCEQNNHDSADAEGRAGFRLGDDAPPQAAPAH